METRDCILGRRSIRKFTDQVVVREEIEKCVELASYTPSWKNTQATRYITVADQGLKEQIADNCVLGFESNGKIIRHCPVLMVMTYKHGISGYERNGEPTTSKGDKWEAFDAGMAAQTFCLAAHDMGLGTVVMGIFDEQKLAETVHVPEGQVPAALIAVGHPAIEPQAPKRKSVEELLTWK